MNRVLRGVACLMLCSSASYLIAWIFAYSIIMRFDYRFVGEYFVLGWIGGGELPSAIQLFAIAGAILWLFLMLWFYWRRQNRGGGDR